MNLKLGFMSYRELSLWFGLSKDRFSKLSKDSKEKKLTILSAYAKFHFEGKKIYIDEIYTPVYSKAKQIIEKEFEKEWGNINSFHKKEKLDTCSRVGTAIYKKNKEVNKQISVKTSINYTNIIKKELYGKNRGIAGTRGKSKYIYLNKEGTDYLSEEQMNIVRECAKKAYNADVLIAQIDDDYRNGEITLEERNEALTNIASIDNYRIYRELLMENLGFIPTKKTQLIKE